MSSMSNERYAAHYLETILGQKMNLIPYTKEYVPQFNQWLQDPEMQQLVATPAVSLETEYAFQEETAHSTDRIIKLIQIKETGEVVGDVDLFFSPEGEAEVNIMIASPDHRRRGYASEALMLLLQYAVQRCDVKKFIAKIGANNSGSLRFFERQGFKATNKEPNVFGEFIYEMDAGDVPESDLNVQSSFSISI